LPDGRSLLVIARGSDQSNTQIWSVSYPGGQARPVTADLNDHRIISPTRDGRSLVSVAGVVSSSVWTLPLRGPGRSTRVSRSTWDGLNGIAFAPDGKLVYTSYVGGVWSLWSAGADGADRSPLLTAGVGEALAYPFVSDDGAVYYASRTRSGPEIRAALKDGSSSRVVTREARFDTFGVTRDGRFLVYGSLVAGVPRLFRIPTEGGERTQISDTVAYGTALHRSGERVAFYHLDSGGRFRIGVASVDGGPLLADLAAEPPTANSRLATIGMSLAPGSRLGPYDPRVAQPSRYRGHSRNRRRPRAGQGRVLLWLRRLSQQDRTGEAIRLVLGTGAVQCSEPPHETSH
jgi:Tol biopolymer transport system component